MNENMKNENIDERFKIEDNNSGENLASKNLKNRKNSKNYENLQENLEKTQKKLKKSQKTNEKCEIENNQKSGKIRNFKSAVVGLTLAVAILGASTLGLGVLYGIRNDTANLYGTQLESVYQKNYYELVDNVNNADMDISKLLNSTSPTYQKKMLTSLSSASKNMQNNIALLPLEGEDVLESVRFVNQLSGYTTVLEEKLANGESLTSEELKTLQELHKALISMKDNLNRISVSMRNGYSILRASNEASGDLNSFTIEFNKIKANDVEYPTMIYDGPFSDSVVNAEVKGLTGTEVTDVEAGKTIEKVFKDLSTYRFMGKTEGKFTTYNFDVTTTDNQNLFAQVTEKGAHLLTVSGQNASDIKNVEMKTGEKIALEFAKLNGIENAEVVWSEELNNQAYFNIAPKENGVVLYPDLVKVKVDLEFGNVIGYDAISYWTNHTDRKLASAGEIKVAIPSGFKTKAKRLVLAPLDYNREVLCYEYECEKEGITYYFYFNAQTGEEENILKVIETTDSSKLM